MTSLPVWPAGLQLHCDTRELSHDYEDFELGIHFITYHANIDCGCTLIRLSVVAECVTWDCGCLFLVDILIVVVNYETKFTQLSEE